MRICIDRHEHGGNTCTLCIEPRGQKCIYIVTAYESGDGITATPIKRTTCPITDERKARATFKRYIKRYCQ